MLVTPSLHLLQRTLTFWKLITWKEWCEHTLRLLADVICNLTVTAFIMHFSCPQYDFENLIRTHTSMPLHLLILSCQKLKLATIIVTVTNLTILYCLHEKQTRLFDTKNRDFDPHPFCLYTRSLGLVQDTCTQLHSKCTCRLFTSQVSQFARFFSAIRVLIYVHS